MPPLTIPPAVSQVLWHLEKAGYPAYIVGGSLRDALLGKKPHDWDVTTAARPEQMLEIFGAAGLNTIPTGLAHGTVTVVINHDPIECTTYRLDGEYTDARHPDRVEFTDRIADDLCRRDFTVNAMACRLPEAASWDSPPTEALCRSEAELEILDLFGGRTDLSARTIRCVGRAEKRFEEDALRILRAVRFSVQLGFDVEDQTEAALASRRAGLDRISVERVASELTRMLRAPRPAKGLALMRKTGLWAHVLPESDPTASPFFANERKLFSAINRLPRDPMVRLSLLLSDKSPDEARAACRRLKLSNEQTAAVAAYVGGMHEKLPLLGCESRRFLARYGTHADGVLALLSLFHEREWARRAKLMADAVRLRGDCLCVADLAVDGKTLMDELGLRGRAVGEMLAYLLDAVLEHASLNTRETLLAMAEEKQKETV